MLGGRPSRRGFTQVSSATIVEIHSSLVVGNTCVQVVYSSPYVLMQGELVGVGAASLYACVCGDGCQVVIRLVVPTQGGCTGRGAFGIHVVNSGDVCRVAVRLGVLTQVSCGVF